MKRYLVLKAKAVASVIHVINYIDYYSFTDSGGEKAALGWMSLVYNVWREEPTGSLIVVVVVVDSHLVKTERSCLVAHQRFGLELGRLPFWPEVVTTHGRCRE